MDLSTGQPLSIPPLKDSIPQCDDDSGSSIDDATVVPSGPWFKCPAERKKEFRTRLMEKMREEWTRRNQGRESDERVARWKFEQMDSDGDGVRRQFINDNRVCHKEWQCSSFLLSTFLYY